MKISINNFKSIGSLARYEMSPLTILSGTNSSGKSSFIQCLLLLKQTLELDSSKFPIILNGYYYAVRSFLNVLKDQLIENKIKIEFIFNKAELADYKTYNELNIYDAFENYDLHIEVEFDASFESRLVVSSFVAKIVTDLKSDYIKFTHDKGSYNIETNVAVFSEKLYGNEYNIRKINYSSFFPSDYEIEFNDGSVSKEVPKLDGVKAILKDFFSGFNYVGPSRQAPKDEYSITGKNNSVGAEGENVAETLYELAESPVEFYKINDSGEVLMFVNSKDTFINAVKYWVCERFRLCSDIYLKKEADSYVIYVKSMSGVVSTIKHVGFGISQILPIVVEGLRIYPKQILALEQPEIHLHPKVQSNLMDFLISLITQKKNVIVETHSDHMITRLRRRIAEDSGNLLDNQVLLTFVEVGKNDVLFRNINIDDFGVIELPYPDEFIERTDVELKAILKAQMNKRFNQGSK